MDTYLTLILAPCEWRKYIESMDSEKKEILTEELFEICQRAAFLAEYVKNHTTDTDASHAESAKKANRKMQCVRRGLGFSYPAAKSLSI